MDTKFILLLFKNYFSKVTTGYDKGMSVGVEFSIPARQIHKDLTCMGLAFGVEYNNSSANPKKTPRIPGELTLLI
ncbi:hypothetical protein [Chryseobacterium gossypii]|uniref:hypothetical protein n=1 Tax=Chryseobacterium gossypii TaxID=3231602 RepID=UPI003525E42F